VFKKTRAPPMLGVLMGDGEVPRHLHYPGDDEDIATLDTSTPSSFPSCNSAITSLSDSADTLSMFQS